MDRPETSWRIAAMRGLRRRCPRCGQGPLFRRWYSLRSDCASCGLEYEPHAGDTWGFWVIGDRVFLLAAMVLLYFGFTPESWWVRGAFLLVVAGGLVWSMPHRRGLGVALDYVARTRWKG